MRKELKRNHVTMHRNSDVTMPPNKRRGDKERELSDDEKSKLSKHEKPIRKLEQDQISNTVLDSFDNENTGIKANVYEGFSNKDKPNMKQPLKNNKRKIDGRKDDERDTNKIDSSRDYIPVGPDRGDGMYA